MSCIRPGIQSNPSKIASKIATACHLGTANEDVLRRNYAAALARVDILAPMHDNASSSIFSIARL